MELKETKIILKSKLRNYFGPISWTKIVNIRRNIPAFVKRIRYSEYKKLLGYPAEGYPDIYFRKEAFDRNNSYGIGRVLREYAGISKPIKACIEHGVYFGGNYLKDEAQNECFPGLITFGSARRSVLRNVTDKLIFEVGPYIMYAKSAISDKERASLKAELGKIMLVFPQHSFLHVGAKSVFSIDRLIKKVNRIASEMEIDSVLYCLYYDDINMGRAKIYEDAGCIVVSAGHRESTSFLSRLRAYIDLADVTVSNSVGTHIGYSIALGTPHVFLDTETKLVYSDLTHNNILSDRLAFETNEVMNAFSESGEKITKKQIEIVEKYWGTNKFRTSEEMHSVLNIFEDIYQLMRHMSEREAIEKYLLNASEEQLDILRFLAE